MPSSKARITNAVIEALRPGETVYDDGSGSTPGFGVRRRKSVATFFLKYRVGTGRTARQRWLTIGTFGKPWTLDAARREARAQFAAIENPLGRADPRGEAERQKKAGTVADLAADFLAAHDIGSANADGRTKRWSPSTSKTNAQAFGKHILPAFGRSRPADVTRADIAAWHDRIGKAGSPGAANRTLAIFRSMFSWAIRRERLSEPNPCRHIDKFEGRKMERFLSTEELARLGTVLAETEEAEPFAVAAIRLLLLTGARRGEILGLRWQDVDLERGVLNLPVSKTGAKTIFLSPPARELLANLPRLDGNAYVIPGRFPGKALNNLILPWYRIRKKAGLDNVRIHDLRHTFASIGAASGLNLPMIGRLLGHKSPLTTARYAHLVDNPAQAATDRIAASIAASMAGKPAAEVLPLRRRD
jgi:integrase